MLDNEAIRKSDDQGVRHAVTQCLASIITHCPHTSLERDLPRLVTTLLYLAGSDHMPDVAVAELSGEAEALLSQLAVAVGMRNRDVLLGQCRQQVMQLVCVCHLGDLLLLPCFITQLLALAGALCTRNSKHYCGRRIVDSLRATHVIYSYACTVD